MQTTPENKKVRSMDLVVQFMGVIDKMGDGWITVKSTEPESNVRENNRVKDANGNIVEVSEIVTYKPWNKLICFSKTNIVKSKLKLNTPMVFSVTLDVDWNRRYKRPEIRMWLSDCDVFTNQNIHSTKLRN